MASFHHAVSHSLELLSHVYLAGSLAFGVSKLSLVSVKLCLEAKLSGFSSLRPSCWLVEPKEVVEAGVSSVRHILWLHHWLLNWLLGINILLDKPESSPNISSKSERAAT